MNTKSNCFHWPYKCCIHTLRYCRWQYAAKEEKEIRRRRATPCCCPNDVKLLQTAYTRAPCFRSVYIFFFYNFRGRQYDCNLHDPHRSKGGELLVSAMTSQTGNYLWPVWVESKPTFWIPALNSSCLRFQSPLCHEVDFWVLIPTG